MAQRVPHLAATAPEKDIDQGPSMEKCRPERNILERQRTNSVNSLPPRSVKGHNRKSSKDASVSLVPIRQIARDEIPLSWLDVSPILNQNTDDPTKSRFFSTFSSALAAWFKNSTTKPSVLIARDRKSKRLCAVEKVRKGEYALCAIGSWVPEEVVMGPQYKGKEATRKTRSLSVESKGVKRKFTEISQDPIEWWQAAVFSEPEQVLPQPEELASPTKKIKLRMESPTPVIVLSQDVPDLTTNESHITPDLDVIQPVVTKEQLFETLVTQYLDSLYVTRASLAFFAKGPLSRTRTAFSSSSINTLEPLFLPDFSAFLRTIILKLNAVDRKYKDKLPALASDLVLSFTDDEEEAEKAKKRKPRKKKLKLNSDGMYSFENEYVRKWWKGDDPDVSSSAEKKDQKIKRRVGELRIRETLLQIVLVLEVLAIESSSEWKAAMSAKANEALETAAMETQAAETQAAETQSAETQALDSQALETQAMDTETNIADNKKLKTNAKPKRKGKKELDLAIHLDLLVDKMAIWHSIEYEADFLAVAPATGKDAMKTWAMDRLGAFCIDVIIPFYKSRVPDHVATMVKKFGGPSNSPEKPRKSAPSRHKDKPKDKPNAKDAAATKPGQRRLQRTATDSQQHSATKRSPLLTRSNTEPAYMLLDRVKREGSEHPLSALPFLGEQKKKVRKDSADKLKLLQRRVVSLKDMGPSRKRKVAADDEIQAAIAAIKKPNRGGIGREAAEERERRVGASAGAGARKQDSRKALNPRSNVQVAATPRHNRKVDIFANKPSDTQRLSIMEEELQHVPSSGAASRVPDTEVRASVVDMISETPSVSRVKRGLFESMKPPSKFSLGLGSLNEVPEAESPMHTNTLHTTNTIFATPVRPRSRSTFNDDSTNHDEHNTVSDSPTLTRKQPINIPATPEKSIHKSPDIFDAMGWNHVEIDGE
ncbi:hypothetical protein BT63DRAFT_297296 [Microthyrium microscopicum]|uniref:DNA replication regulator Sld3 C-terminal domain-containing protein n=1 Tax=Microthyrium microscopicum TaxID=703497 RepID=A0A6A6U8L9_9PEZI|nr:hypothetical protein BT63DRAFT_297296 [Microthyrium microscopicum]